MPLTDEEKRALDEMGDDRLGQSLYRAARKNPDESAKVIQISDSQGLPTDTVERNLVETEARHKYGDIKADDIRKASPITAEYLQDEDNARVSIDDIPTLRGLERNLKPEPPWWGSNSVRNVGSRLADLIGNWIEWGGTQVEQDWQDSHVMKDLGITGVYINDELYSWADLPDDVPNPLKIMGRYLSEGKTHEYGYVPHYTMDRLWENPTVENVIGFMGEIGPASLIDMGMITTSMAMYLASRNQELAEERARSKGLSPDDVTPDELQEMLAPTVLISALERIGALAVFNMGKVTTAKEAVEAMGRAAAGETATEIPQEIGEYLATTLFTGTPVTLEETAKRGLGGALAGFGVGGTVRAGTASGQLVHHAMGIRAEKNAIVLARSMQEQVKLDEFISLSQSSKTRKRAQDRFKAFLTAAGKDTAIYVHAAEINKLTEQGVELPRYILEQAAEVDSDVEIPVDRFHELEEDVISEIRPHIKLNADTMTQSELEAGQDTSIKALMKRANKSRELKNQADEVFEEVKAQLTATGRQGEETAKWSAAIIPAFATVIAETRGITVREAYAAMNFTVTGPSTPVSDADAVKLAQDDGFRGTDVTEAHEWLAARATPDLDMSFEGRMARADVSHPVRAWHGTTADIYDFRKHDADIGYHFGGTSDQANRRIVQKAKYSGESTEGANIIPARLDLRNPITLDDAGDWRNSTAVAYVLRDAANIDTDATAKFIDLYNEARVIENEFTEEVDWLASPENIEIQDEIRQILKDYGYDGIVYENRAEGAGESYIVFEPEQARSAHAAFDPALKKSAYILAQERRLNKQIGTIESLIECLNKS